MMSNADSGATAPLTVFDFESEAERSLTFMPLSVRMRLDVAGLKVSLQQWSELPLDVRRDVVFAPIRTTAEVGKLRNLLKCRVREHSGQELKEIVVDATAWQQTDEIPDQVRDTLRSLQLPSIQVSEWAELSELQRFALIKLTRTGHTRNLRPALREFGLLPP